MPLYEYVCKSCGHHTEVSQSFKDAPLTTCPVCGGELRKLFSSPGILFKGSGFYRTDSRMPAKSGADKGDSGAGDKVDKDKGDTDKGKGDKGDTAEKPAAASGTKSDAKPSTKSPPAAAKTGDVAKSA